MSTVDARGKACPLPIVLVAQAVRAVEKGESVLIHADDRAFPEDLRAWCSKTGNPLLSLEAKSGFFEARVKKV
jgi:TusA-related sulfurtransferase